MMKPLSFTLAALGLLSVTTAQAQSSSVEVFGLLDLNYLHLSSDSNSSLTRMGSDGNLSSRLGFRGTEDLGGGLKAGFWLEGAFNPADGNGSASSSTNQPLASGAPAASSGFNFNRRSTLSVSSNWGEVRLGRDYVPAFWNLSQFSPFGTNGIGSAGYLFYPTQSAARVTHVRASNSVGYFTPEMGGFYGQAMVALGGNPSNSGAKSDDGNVRGLRLGYAKGVVNVALATTRTTYAALGDYQQNNLGGSYDFGPVKLMALWGENRTGAGKTSAKLIGAQVPVGAGQIRASYAKVNASGLANDATHLALGYVHNLSKRTALYGHYARLANQNQGKTFDLGLAVSQAGGSSTGYEFGVRHAF